MSKRDVHEVGTRHHQGPDPMQLTFQQLGGEWWAIIDNPIVLGQTSAPGSWSTTLGNHVMNNFWLVGSDGHAVRGNITGVSSFSFRTGTGVAGNMHAYKIAKNAGGTPEFTYPGHASGGHVEFYQESGGRATMKLTFSNQTPANYHSALIPICGFDRYSANFYEWQRLSVPEVVITHVIP